MFPRPEGLDHLRPDIGEPRHRIELWTFSLPWRRSAD
jgi:hypothetical protein